VPKKMRTSGDLRDFLMEMIAGVRDGSVDLQRASVAAKLAAQVTASLSAEAQMVLVEQKCGRQFGSAALGAPDAEAKAQPALQAPIKGSPVWCEQCEQRVHPSRAMECKSPFCKARAAIPNEGEANARG
jgi:hypothetical protein